MSQGLCAVGLACFIALAPIHAAARGSGSHSGGHSGSHSDSHSGSRSGNHSGSAASPAPRIHSSSNVGGELAHHSRANAVAGVKRDTSGAIARSPQAKADFKKSDPCPSTRKASEACPGYVVDHVQPLKRGGADSPANMQWQTTAAAKAKDKVE